MDKKIYLTFHVGRGGRFHNPGHLSFQGEYNFGHLLWLRSNDGSIFIHDEDEDGNEMEHKNWYATDQAGNVLLEGDEIFADTGTLNFDNGYDSDYTISADCIPQKELDCLWEEYLLERNYLSEELKDIICKEKGYLRAKGITRYPSQLRVETQDSYVIVDFDNQIGEFSQIDWDFMLEYDYNFCPLSRREILEVLETVSNEEFFA